MRIIVLLCFVFALNGTVNAQDSKLQSGPMVGYSTMKEVLLWVQTKTPAEVQFTYWVKGQPKRTFHTEKFLTSKQNTFVARLLADSLEPSNHYEYALYIDGQKTERPYKLEFESQPIWKWRADAPDFSFATGSCAYICETPYDRPGTPYGSNYQIFEDIHRKDPDFMLWLGDNIYLREADWYSETGIMHRYSHMRSTPEIQPMLGSMHHYAVWDDHDYGTNNSDRSFPLKDVSEKAFKRFFANPNYIFDEGTTGFFQWSDCEFFLLDNRFWRTPDKRSDIKQHDILGDRQVEWLIDALVNSYAPFKFVVIGGQFLNPLDGRERFEYYAPAEKAKIIKAIQELKIRGVIFLTGDVHYTELSKLEVEGGYPLYDLTVSPLTSGVYDKKVPDNPLQVPGTFLAKHNYAHIKVFGDRKNRALEIIIYDSNGVKEWSKIIRADELRFPR